MDTDLTKWSKKVKLSVLGIATLLSMVKLGALCVETAAYGVVTIVCIYTITQGIVDSIQGKNGSSSPQK